MYGRVFSTKVANDGLYGDSECLEGGVEDEGELFIFGIDIDDGRGACGDEEVDGYIELVDSCIFD